MSYLNKSNYLQPIIICLELIILFVILFYFLGIQYDENGLHKDLITLIRDHYKAYIILSISWFFMGSFYNVYRMERGVTLDFILEKTTYQLIFFSIVLFAVSGIKSYDLLNITNSIKFISLLTLIIFIYRITLFFILKVLRKRGWGAQNVLCIDYNSNSDNFVKVLKNKELGYNMKLWLFNKNNEGNVKPEQFNTKYLKKLVRSENIESIFLSLDGKLNEKNVEDIKLFANKNKLEINYIPSLAMLGYNDLKMDYIYTHQILKEVLNPLDYFVNRFFKRAFDLILSFLALSVLSVTVFPIISLLVYLDSGLPVFFKQKRKGINNKVFYCYKFRTMKVNEDSDKKITVKGDKRITRIGSFLRKSSLDELPQLFNVLIGDMSVVGPRPHMLRQDIQYDDVIKYYALRNHVKPGITGLAQVSGYRGEINSDEDMRNRVRSDLYYIKNWSFSLDIIIMIKTVLYMIIGDENAV